MISFCKAWWIVGLLRLTYDDLTDMSCAIFDLAGFIFTSGACYMLRVARAVPFERHVAHPWTENLIVLSLLLALSTGGGLGRADVHVAGALALCLWPQPLTATLLLASLLHLLPAALWRRRLPFLPALASAALFHLGLNGFFTQI